MCDPADFAEDQRYADARWTRRGFGVLAGLAALWPSAADAVELAGDDVVVKTPDGDADAFFVHPATGKHPAVLIWPDIFGLRPAFRQMARRLAEAGYAVLVVNPYYRTVRAPVLPDGVDMRSDENFAKVRVHAKTLDPTKTVTDARALVAWLDAHPAVDAARKVGVAGYCMGGSMVMRTAAALPERVGAGGVFHGGGLATDKPDSPHRLIPQMKASFLVAIAENDDASDPAAKDTLRAAFAAAKLDAEIEVYAGTRHGWCPPDASVYDAAQADRAFNRWTALLTRALGAP